MRIGVQMLRRFYVEHTPTKRRMLFAFVLCEWEYTKTGFSQHRDVLLRIDLSTAYIFNGL